MEKLADGMDLVGEPLPGLPLVELAGDNRVLIEHHKGVVQYCRERICIRVSYGTVCVCGAGLELSRMTGEQLVISGRIDQVTLSRKGAC